MKKIVYTISLLAAFLTTQEAFSQRESRTEAKCYSGRDFRINGALDRCDDFCKDNGYRGAEGWKCGSDVKCEDSKCVCICVKRSRDEERDKERDRDRKKKDDSTIKIPLGDKLNIEIK